MSERVLNSVELKQAWQAFQASLVAAAETQERINQAAEAGDPNLRAMIVAAADAAHTQWPQYAGKWNGPEWEIVRVRAQVKTGLGIAFEAGDVTIAHRQFLGGWIAYSIRNTINTQLAGKGGALCLN